MSYLSFQWWHSHPFCPCQCFTCQVNDDRLTPLAVPVSVLLVRSVVTGKQLLSSLSVSYLSGQWWQAHTSCCPCQCLTCQVNSDTHTPFCPCQSLTCKINGGRFTPLAVLVNVVAAVVLSQSLDPDARVAVRLESSIVLPRFWKRKSTVIISHENQTVLSEKSRCSGTSVIQHKTQHCSKAVIWSWGCSSVGTVSHWHTAEAGSIP